VSCPHDWETPESKVGNIMKTLKLVSGNEQGYYLPGDGRVAGEYFTEIEVKKCLFHQAKRMRSASEPPQGQGARGEGRLWPIL
jgi:hypothetical protein